MVGDANCAEGKRFWICSDTSHLYPRPSTVTQAGVNKILPSGVSYGKPHVLKVAPGHGQ